MHARPRNLHINQVPLLPFGQLQWQCGNVVVHDGSQIRGTPVVEVRRMLPQRSERRRPIQLRRASAPNLCSMVRAAYVSRVRRVPRPPAVPRRAPVTLASA